MASAGKVGRWVRTAGAGVGVAGVGAAEIAHGESWIVLICWLCCFDELVDWTSRPKEICVGPVVGKKNMNAMKTGR